MIVSLPTPLGPEMITSIAPLAPSIASPRVRRASVTGRPRAARRAPISSSGGSGAVGADEVAVRRRRQLEPPGVEEEPVEAVRPAPRGPGAVDRVARDRVADRLEMDPDLVGPAGHEVQLEQRPAGEPLADAVARHRRPAVGDDRHPGPVLRVAPDRRLDPADRRRDAPLDECLVRLLDPARLELGHERVPARRRAGRPSAGRSCRGRGDGRCPAAGRRRSRRRSTRRRGPAAR